MAAPKKHSNKSKDTQKSETATNRDKSLQGNERDLDPLEHSMRVSQAGTNRPGTQSDAHSGTPKTDSHRHSDDQR